MIANSTAVATGGIERRSLTQELFSENVLSVHVFLKAVQRDDRRTLILLMDELDRTDDPFQAFLLEALSGFRVYFIEFENIKAPEPPIVIMISKQTSEVPNSIKRRFLYHNVDHPDFERELAICHAQATDFAVKLSHNVVKFFHAFRQKDLLKKPCVTETIDWIICLSVLGCAPLSYEVIAAALGILKCEIIFRSCGDQSASRF